MTSYISDIAVTSAIVAALGVAAYMVMPTPQQRAASALHAKAWGKPWPQSKGIIYKYEIDNETGSVDDDNDDDDNDNDDVVYGLAEKLSVPKEFQYVYLKEIRSLKNYLGLRTNKDYEDILVVRDEYEKLRHALEVNLEEDCNIIVTGHPGIGKSTFLFYLLLYRLERKLPTAIQLDARYYLIFDKRGAKVCPLSRDDPRLEKCWALADSDNLVRQPCAAFQHRAEFVILASSPKPERWREWLKQAGGRCIFSDLPSVPEIAAIAKEASELRKQLGKRPMYDPASVLSLVRKWGPSIRNVFRSMNRAARGLDDPIQREATLAAEQICEKPSNMFGQSSGMRMPSSEGSTVMFLRPYDGLKDERSTAFIPTPHLLSIFEEYRRQKSNKEFLELFYLLSSHAVTRAGAGWAHETLVHNRLGMGGEPLRIYQDTIQGTIENTMQPSPHLLSGTLNGLEAANVTDSFYWIPTMANFPGVDSVLGDTDGHVYTIQATIAGKHGNPKQGIKKVWDHFRPDVRAGRTWHFVAITNTKHTADKLVGEFSTELHNFRLGQAPVQIWACVLRS